MGNPCSKGSKDDKSDSHNDREKGKNKSKTLLVLVPFLPYFCPRVGMSVDILEKIYN